MIRRVFERVQTLFKRKPKRGGREPKRIAASEHHINRELVSRSALRICETLQKAGHRAYIVGGAVRDLLLDIAPKDFDIATDATPEQIKSHFRRAFIIGRRFKLVHVMFGQETIEVSTFRALVNVDRVIDEHGRVLSDNLYGEQNEDSARRDFTINALYYDPTTGDVLDYHDGVKDIRARRLRMIGEPTDRYREDPVRMLRAVRFAAKLGFRIHSEAEAPIRELGSLLESVPAARLFDEVLKMFHGGYAHATFELLRHYGLLSYLFPMTESALRHEDGGFPLTFVARALENTDLRINDNKPVTPSFLYGVLLWEPVRERLQRYMEQDMSEIDAMQRAADEVIAAQLRRTSLPRRFSVPMREIWLMQPRFRQRQGKRPLRLLGHPRFRAAYDFLCLRAAAGEALQEDCQWWTDLQTMDTDAHQGAVSQARKRPRRRKPASARANANA